MMINISLTDDLDPLFLFTTDIGEQDYQTIRNEQSLMGDFQGFPGFLARLLENCVNTMKEEFGKGANPWSCIFTLLHNEAVLTIQETNLYKQVCVIALRFRAANESVLKKHLSSLVRDFKSKCENSEKENHKLNDNLSRLNSEFHITKEELNTFRNTQ
jgi:spindle assembly abnormal protein 6